MAFDRDAFLASFLNQMSSGIAQKRQEAEKYKEKQEAAYERNQQLIATRNARASQAVSLGKQALQYLPEGANSKAMVRTALASGMTGVQEFRDKLAQAHANAGLRAGERLSVQDVEAIISMPNIPSIDQSLIDMSLEDFAKKTYGAKVEAAPAQEDDPSIIGQLFGIGAKDRVKRELRETEAFDGMSIADVNAAARMNDFNSLIPNAVMSFAEMERFDRNDAIKFSRALAAEYDEALTSRAADDAATAAMTAFLSTDAGKNAGPDEIDNVKKMARIAYAQKFVKRTIETESGIYGEMLLNNEIAAQQIKNLMGENYYNTILSDYSLSDEEEGDGEGDGDGELPTTPKPEGADELLEKPVEELLPPETTPPVIDPVEPRPGGRRGFSSQQRAWDNKYGGKFDPVTGEAIIVEPRPADGGPATGRGRNKKTAAEKWDSKYGDTHNPDGTPKAVEE
jgi:hypothetical protein